jgi:lamin tail-like protein
MRYATLAAAASMLAAASCGGVYSDAPAAPNRVFTSVVLSLADTAAELGQFTLATASARDQFGAPFDAGQVLFASSAPEIAGVNPVDGRILAISAGTTTITASVGGKSASRALIVSNPPLFINEVTPLGDAVNGWAELFNPTDKPVDLGGWTITNADVFQTVRFPDGVVIPARGFLVIDERTFPEGLGARGFVHLFSKFGVQSDAFAWGHDPGTSYGRCPDGESGLGETAVATKGGPNACF